MKVYFIINYNFHEALLSSTEAECIATTYLHSKMVRNTRKTSTCNSGGKIYLPICDRQKTMKGINNQRALKKVYR